MNKRFVVILNDCHLSAGKYLDGKLNPHEDFKFDSQMCQLIEHFSHGEFEHVPVELFLNGDYFDFLNVPIQGEFEDVITEEISCLKVEAILKGHPEVMQALKTFASLTGKTITYLIGNHDADLFFPKVRETITRAWDPHSEYPSLKVNLIASIDRVRFPEGVEIHHGNQFEAVHQLDFQQPLIPLAGGSPILNLPWGSTYVLKIINRLKTEREFIDKVRPVKIFVFFGFLLDPIFTFKFVFLSIFYFLKTRFVFSPKRSSSLRMTLEILRQESDLLIDLEKQARKLLDQEKDLHTVIFGHTHKPMKKVYPDGKQYINTGTWTKMINLDLRSFGQQYCLTYGFVTLQDGKSHCELKQWLGNYSPERSFEG